MKRFDKLKKMDIKDVATELCEADLISRSEAIRIASGYCHWTNIPDELAKLPSVNPKHCEDAISRQALKDLGAECIAKRDENGNLIPLGCIDSLPSVSTEKIGRWNKKYDSIVNDYFWECDICKCGFQRDYPYCPNCGAKMEGVEE